MPKVLSRNQIAQYHEQGFLLLENALDSGVLTALRADFGQWVADSRQHSESYGTQPDGRPRFSLEPGHTEHPALRRIASPVEISQAHLDVMRDSPALDAISQLIGPNVKFSNSKVNLKHPGAATVVKFHQDFMFEAHTNDSLVTVLYFIDDVTLENGPLEVVPGSHNGPLHSHWHNDVFTGAVSEDVGAQCRRDAIPCYGPAGTACLMHTRLLHGSAANRSAMPRTLYIISYAAEDAQPLHTNHIPSSYDGEVVRGQATNRVRCSDYSMELPEYPAGASFFEQQVLMIAKND